MVPLLTNNKQKTHILSNKDKKKIEIIFGIESPLLTYFYVKLVFIVVCTTTTFNSQIHLKTIYKC